MKAGWIALLLILVCISSEAQNLPYLNASPGNANQSVVDKDTNLYMFHGDRLEKLNKNLVPVWVNTYSNINFSNLLLSKTGSIFFIAQNKIGKINSNGTLNWAKAINQQSVTIGATTVQINSLIAKQIFLDRNNNLIITGSFSDAFVANGTVRRGFVVKMDTLGAIIKTRFFYYTVGTDNSKFDGFNIINDSLGNYKIFVDEVNLSGRAGFIFNYSELLDSVNIKRHLTMFDNSSTTTNYGQPVYFYKSKFGSGFYVATAVKSSANITSIAITKYHHFKGLISGYNPGLWGAIDRNFKSFNEDEKGNVILTIHCLTSISGPSGTYSKGCIILDSNSVKLSGVQVLNNQPINPYITYNFHTLHNNNYYFDATGSVFPTNPLTMASTNSAVPCYSPMPAGTTSSCSSPPCILGPLPFTVKTINACSFFITPDPSTVTAVSFSVAQNYCSLISNVSEQTSKKSNFNVYPNPFTNKIIIKNDVDDLINVSVYNCAGALVKTINFNKQINEIDLENAAPGIYFIRIYSDKGVEVKKVIKE